MSGKEETVGVLLTPYDAEVLLNILYTVSPVKDAVVIIPRIVEKLESELGFEHVPCNIKHCGNCGRFNWCSDRGIAGENINCPKWKK